MLQEFKEFALKGNVVDLAVGVIIGGAFGKIVTSLVNDILMPAIGVILGGISFTDLKYVITPAVGNTSEVAILYGSFIQSVIDFLIVAFSMFLFVKLFSIKKKTVKEAILVIEEPNEEVKLLEEIRDVLKQSMKD